MTKKIVSTIISVTFVCFIQAQTKDIQIFIENDKCLRNANVSFQLSDLTTGKSLVSYRSDNLAVPASTLKLITTATALETLGGNFRFETLLQTDGTISAEGKLTGNIYIKGSGDPTLGSEHMGDSDFLTKWTNAILSAGIRTIEGSIIADASLFDTEGVNPKWLWEDIGNYFAPGAYAISYLDNTYRLVLRSDIVGTKPRIIGMSPQIPELVFENNLTTFNIKKDSAYIYGAPRSNFRTIYGAIPASMTRFTIKGDIPNPETILVRNLSTKLQERGVVIHNNPNVERSERKTIYTHYSPVLSEIIKEINVNSNNHYAEHLFRYLSLSNSSVASSTNAARYTTSFWEKKRLSTEQVYIVDGSGLSPANAVSANFLVEMLTYMNNTSKESEAFYNSLPVAGINGTLSFFLKGTNLQGRVIAKSGSLTRVRCYAGYIKSGNNNYVFSILVNNANGTSQQVIKKVEELLLTYVQ